MAFTVCILFLVGLLLSRRFNFLTLYPSIVSVIICAVVRSAAYGDDVGATGLMIALGVAALQMGYFSGLIVAAYSGIPEREGKRPRGTAGGVPRISPRHKSQTVSQITSPRSSAGTMPNVIWLPSAAVTYRVCPRLGR
jgi:hypothetical protein